MGTRGIAYIAIGAKARAEASASIEALKDDYPVAIIETAEYSDPVQASRWAKVNLDRLIPNDWTQCLYLDADTRIRGDISAGFAALSAGWDMAAVPSANQGLDAFWHIGIEERDTTANEVGMLPLQIQAGVLWFSVNDAVKSFFAVWRKEWERWKGQDQAAFVRALFSSPVRLWLLGHPYNGGAVVAHRFGATRRNR